MLSGAKMQPCVRHLSKAQGGGKTTSLSRNRNIGIVAHVDAGKTTTSEHMLNLCGATSSVGRVDSGDTIMDFLPQERERGITIQSAAITMNWKDSVINLIDTPGHVDFTVEVERCARVLDGVVVVIDAVSGVQAQTKTVWKQTQRRKLPSILFINKMDRVGASFKRAVESASSKLNCDVIQLQLSLGSEDNFDGVIDLVNMTKLEWRESDQKNKPLETRDIVNESDPAFAECLQARLEMLERLAECDESFMEDYLIAQEISDDSSRAMLNKPDFSSATITAALRRACLDGAVVPAICGASLRGKGVEPLLDSILSFLPSPVDAPNATAIHKSNGKIKELSVVNTKDLCTFAFKIVYDKLRGPLVFVRNYSGTLTDRAVLLNTTQGRKERVNQLLSVSADDLDQIKVLGPGQVGCLVGLKHTRTGDTLVIDKGPLQHHVLEGLTLPRQVFSLAIEPERSSQQSELEEALHILCTEDPSLTFRMDEESGQNLIGGLGELHLEIVCDKLRRRFDIDVDIGDAYVAYRESLREDGGPTTKSLQYDRTIGTKRLFADVTMEIAPVGNTEAPSVVVSSDLKASLTLDERVALLEGIEASLARGPRGYPVVGLQVTVKSVERDADTTPGAIRACCSIILDSVLRGPGQALLEPVMALEIEAPSRCVGDVLSDLTVKRRAQVKDLYTSEQDSANSLVIAHAPLASLLGYATAIRSMTSGEGSFSMEFADFSSPLEQHIIEEFVGRN